MTTISIIKDVLTKEATKRRTKLEILLGKQKLTSYVIFHSVRFEIKIVFYCCHSDVNRASVSFTIGLIEPKLIEHIKVHKDYQTTSNLIDLDIQDRNELKSLGFDYADILENKNKIIETYNRTSHMLERVKQFIHGIYVDYNKLRGTDVQQDIPKLNKLIENYHNDRLVNFILGVKSDDNF